MATTTRGPILRFLTRQASGITYAGWDQTATRTTSFGGSDGVW